MVSVSHALRFLLVALAGWINQQQREVIDYLQAENRDWGYTRIQGALANLGHDVGRGTIATILKQHRSEPAPERRKRTTWREFLKGHWDVLTAAVSSRSNHWMYGGP